MPIDLLALLLLGLGAWAGLAAWRIRGRGQRLPVEKRGARRTAAMASGSLGLLAFALLVLAAAPPLRGIALSGVLSVYNTPIGQFGAAGVWGSLGAFHLHLYRGSRKANPQAAKHHLIIVGIAVLLAVFAAGRALTGA
jgi:hypothetical protein